METSEIYEEAKQVWNPTKPEYWENLGINIVLDKRAGYEFWTKDGNRVINMHLNGGVYNLGHRNKEIIQALIEGTEKYDAGNHYFPSEVKNELCKRLLATAPKYMKYVYMNNGGGESIDSAIKFARYATKRTRVISMLEDFHGATGFAFMSGSDLWTDYFYTPVREEDFTRIHRNDLETLETILKKEDTACVLMEIITAGTGFQMPDKEYIQKAVELCHKYGAVFIDDEVQVGLMRTGKMWCCESYEIEPDMIVTGKGLSGGIYPMSAVIMNEKASAWMQEDGSTHLSSFSACELGCVVANKAVEITTRTSTGENVRKLEKLYHDGLTELQQKHNSFMPEFYQIGVIMGLQTSEPEGAVTLMQELYKRGVWAIRSGWNHSALQFKAGLLMDEKLAQETLNILDDALTACKKIYNK